MFDLSELTMPTPSARFKHDWLCTQCRRVSMVRGSCASCGGQEYIAHLDRRPLLLSKEVRNGIIDLIDQAADLVPELNDIDAQLQITGEYMPFLSKLLSNAELAEDRRLAGDPGFRKTDLSVEELLALFKEMKLPPTAE